MIPFILVVIGVAIILVTGDGAVASNSSVALHDDKLPLSETEVKSALDTLASSHLYWTQVWPQTHFFSLHYVIKIVDMPGKIKMAF